MGKMIYLDNAATTKTAPEVVEAMLPYFTEMYGNPSSIYDFASKSKEGVSKARGQIADALGAKKEEIYFTAGGSESDNWALKATFEAYKSKGNHIITTKIEHHAILHTCEYLEKERGAKITYLDVDENGIVDLKQLEEAIRPDTILISIMFANNEVGTIEPIEDIAKIAHNHNIVFHTDAVQAIGNVRIDVRKMGIDALSMSAHKFYGPKGIGALYVKDGIEFQRIQDGGHQERDKRAGTENVAEIVGIGKAIELAYQNFDRHCEYLKSIRDYYISKVEKEIPYAKLNGDRVKRLPGNANFSFEGLSGEKMLFTLDLHGICASAGSACNTGEPGISHVIESIGVPKEYADGTIRFTLGEENTISEVDRVMEILKAAVSVLRE